MAKTPLHPQLRAYLSRQRMPRSTRRSAHMGKRARGKGLDNHSAYVPPEDWHEPQSAAGSAGRSFRIVSQPPGPGYTHAVTPDEIRARLAQLPASFLKPLEVVQLSRMTRKKRSFPCYGMQWGSTIYLYPIEDGLVEYLTRPPRPAEMNEARMYGVRWVQDSAQLWRLDWTPASIRDFYLNNILIHELGHLLDDRNNSYRERERFAEWFAVEFGYRATSRHWSHGVCQRVGVG